MEMVAARVKRFARQLALFFDGALAQMPDGGAAYYDSCNPFLPDIDKLRG